MGTHHEIDGSIAIQVARGVHRRAQVVAVVVPFDAEVLHVANGLGAGEVEQAAGQHHMHEARAVLPLRAAGCAGHKVGPSVSIEVGAVRHASLPTQVGEVAVAEQREGDPLIHRAPRHAAVSPKQVEPPAVVGRGAVDTNPQHELREAVAVDVAEDVRIPVGVLVGAVVLEPDPSRVFKKLVDGGPPAGRDRVAPHQHRRLPPRHREQQLIHPVAVDIAIHRQRRASKGMVVSSPDGHAVDAADVDLGVERTQHEPHTARIPLFVEARAVGGAHRHVGVPIAVEVAEREHMAELAADIVAIEHNGIGLIRPHRALESTCRRGPIAVVVEAVAADLFCIGVHGRVGIITVAVRLGHTLPHHAHVDPLGSAMPIPIGIEPGLHGSRQHEAVVGIIHQAIAVVVHPVAGLAGARMDRGVLVVAVFGRGRPVGVGVNQSAVRVGLVPCASQAEHKGDQSTMQAHHMSLQGRPSHSRWCPDPTQAQADPTPPHFGPPSRPPPSERSLAAAEAHSDEVVARA